MGGFDEANQKLEKKAKTISEHTVEKAKIWNRSRYRQAELYGQQKVVLLSDIEAVLGDLQKTLKGELEELPIVVCACTHLCTHKKVRDWKEKAEKLLEPQK